MKRLSMVKKIMVALLSVLMVFSVSMGLATIKSAKALAEEPTMKMVYGASVRMENPNGIRFQAELNQAKVDEIFAEGSNKQLGMFIVPANYFDDFLASERTLNFYDYCKDVKKTMVDFKFTKDQLKVEGNKYLARASLVDILFKNLNLEFNAGVYVESLVDGKVNERELVYNDTMGRSISYVASVAINKGETSEYLTTTLKNAGYDKLGVTYNYETKKYTYNGTEYDTLEAIEIDPLSAYDITATEKTIKVADSCVIENDNLKTINTVYESANPEIALGENGVVHGVSKGQTEITVKVGDLIVRKCTVTVEEAPAPKHTIVDFSSQEKIDFIKASGTVGTMAYDDTIKFNGKGTLGVTAKAEGKEDAQFWHYTSEQALFGATNFYMYVYNNTDKLAQINVGFQPNGDVFIPAKTWKRVDISKQALLNGPAIDIMLKYGLEINGSINLSSIYTDDDINVVNTSLPVFDLSDMNNIDTVNTKGAVKLSNVEFDGKKMLEVDNPGVATSEVCLNIDFAKLNYVKTFGMWIYNGLNNNAVTTFNVCWQKQFELVKGFNYVTFTYKEFSESNLLLIWHDGQKFDGTVAFSSIYAVDTDYNSAEAVKPVVDLSTMDSVDMTKTKGNVSLSNKTFFDGKPMLQVDNRIGSELQITETQLNFDNSLLKEYETFYIWVYDGTRNNIKATINVGWIGGDYKLEKGWNKVEFNLKQIANSNVIALWIDGALFDGEMYISSIFGKDKLGARVPVIDFSTQEAIDANINKAETTGATATLGDRTEMNTVKLDFTGAGQVPVWYNIEESAIHGMTTVGFWVYNGSTKTIMVDINWREINAYINAGAWKYIEIPSEYLIVNLTNKYLLINNAGDSAPVIEGSVYISSICKVN